MYVCDDVNDEGTLVKMEKFRRSFAGGELLAHCAIPSSSPVSSLLAA